jgi:hypothetical protein
MIWGDLARYNLDIGGEMADMVYKARIWEEDESVLSAD